MDRIDALTAAAVGSGGPGAAVAVLRGGDVAHQGCFGLADLEWRQPIMPDTVFALASLTKPFTALTVILLHQDGMIDLDAPIGDYLPDYPGPGRAAAVRHLLTHTSGIPNFVTQPGFRRRSHMHHTTDELLAVFADLPLDFAPGTRYGYSNSGYRLLDLIIEKVTATPFAQILTDRVLHPAGMTSARLLNDEVLIPHRARGYQIAQDGTAAPIRLPSTSITGGAGGLAASLDDLAHFDQAIREHRILDTTLDEQMRTPAALTCGRTEGRGLGWVLTRYRDTDTFGHAGGIEGYSCIYQRFPTHDTSIIILTNRHGFSCYNLARQIADDVLDLPATPNPPACDRTVPADLAGTYRSTLDTAHLDLAAGGLLLRQWDTPRHMIPLDDTTYADRDDPDIRLRIHRTTGQPTAITIDYPFTWFTGYQVNTTTTPEPSETNRPIHNS